MDDSEQYGPALPPGMVAGGSGSGDQKPEETKVIGPGLPGNLQKSTDSDDMSDEGQLIVKVEHDNNEQDDGSVGPIVAEMAQEGDDVMNTADEFERRSKRMKDKLNIKSESSDTPVKREEWMTELPPEMGKNFGLGKRTFSKADGSAEDKDRSGWTDTPNVKKEKEANSKGKKRKREDEKVSGRDQKLHQQVEEYNKSNRSESLLDMHSKLQKKKKKKDKKEKKKKRDRGEKEKKEPRQPFDRDKDLHANVFDDAQRKALVKKSQELNTRFSFGGATSHFL